MKLTDFLSKLQQLSASLPDVAETILKEESETLNNSIRSRIRGSGKASTKQLSPYSTKNYPKNHKGKREKLGLQTGYKDLTITGGLLDSIAVVRTEKSQSGVSVYSSVNKDKQNNGRRYEDIVIGLTKQEGLGEEYVTKPTQKELDDATAKAENRLFKHIKDSLS